MSLIERQEVDKMEVLADSTIQVRTATVIEKDGVEISRSVHRHVKHPGDDTTDEDARVKDIASTLWTPAVVKAREDFVAAQALSEE